MIAHELGREAYAQEAPVPAGRSDDGRLCAQGWVRLAMFRGEHRVGDVHRVALITVGEPRSCSLLVVVLEWVVLVS